jgi:hypothetical protein
MYIYLSVSTAGCGKKLALLIFFFMVLGIESSTSFILDKHSTIELYSQPILLIFISYSKKY